MAMVIDSKKQAIYTRPRKPIVVTDIIMVR
jgi:hypothetical protein